MATQRLMRRGRKHHHTATILSLLFLAAVVLSTGCSSPAATTLPSAANPWQEDFDRGLERTTTDVGGAVLADSVITDDEMAELNGLFVECLSLMGFSDVTLYGAGGFVLAYPDGVPREGDTEHELVRQCYASTDWDIVASLYWRVLGNPENRPVEEIMAECLVRLGVREPGYTPDDYDREDVAGCETPLCLSADSPELEKFWACTLDPAHAE
jgi:hypothetical protein